MLYQNRAEWRPRARQVHVLLVLAVALVGLHAPVATGWADELIVDDADAAVQRSGAWEASATTPGFYGGGYLFHASGHGTATIRWPFPAGGAPGRYDVFVRWSSGPNRASTARYDVVDATGATHVTRNQQIGGGRWQALGTFTFDPGQAQGVTLSGDADGVGRRRGCLGGSSGYRRGCWPHRSGRGTATPARRGSGGSAMAAGPSGFRESGRDRTGLWRNRSDGAG